MVLSTTESGSFTYTLHGGGFRGRRRLLYPGRVRPVQPRANCLRNSSIISEPFRRWTEQALYMARSQASDNGSRFHHQIKVSDRYLLRSMYLIYLALSNPAADERRRAVIRVELAQAQAAGRPFQSLFYPW